MITRRALTVSGLALASFGGRSSAQLPLLLVMSAPRACYGVAALNDGSVLLMGGCTADGCEPGPASSTVDRFDPATRRISQVGTLRQGRVQAATCALVDGRVLMAGGWTNGRLTETIECFDPRTGKSADAGRMSSAQPCMAAALPDGRALLIGTTSIDAYDPATGRLALLNAFPAFKESSSVTLLDDGRVLITGGGVTGPAHAEAFLLDPKTGRVEQTGSLAGERNKHAAVKLLDGRVLVVGGSDRRGRNGGKLKLMEVYDPRTGRFETVGETHEARFKIPDAALRLTDGRVLVAGDADKPEVIDPKTWKTRTIEISLGDRFNFAGAALLPNGDVLVAGGYSEGTINPTSRAWIIPKAAMT